MGLEKTCLEKMGLEKTGLEKTGSEKMGLEKMGLEKMGLVTHLKEQKIIRMSNLLPIKLDPTKA